MLSCINQLKKEHDNILEMLDVVQCMSLQILDGAEVDTGDFLKVVQFIRLYADKTHHGKEEEFLFRHMGLELGPPGQHLISQGMLIEHDLGRLYCRDLEEATMAYQENPNTPHRLAILVAAGSYANLLKRHIEKENTAVYPFGERSLKAETLTQIEEDSKAFEAEPENRRIREEQLQVLRNLQQKYL